jgi:hypothetical protein
VDTLFLLVKNLEYNYMEFIKYIWDSDNVAHVTLIVKEYPDEGVALDDLKPMIHEIREKSSGMIIKADLAGAGIVSIDRFKLIVKIVREVVDYTRNDNILRQVQFLNTGFVFRMLYQPISFAIPKYFRDIIVFL